MKPTAQNRIKLLSTPHNLQKPDPKNGHLLAINTILSGLCESVEAQIRKGERNFAAESWAELASDLIHALPDRKVVCIQTGTEDSVFRNAKAAFAKSLNKRPDKTEFGNIIKWMIQAARAATQTHECDTGHIQLLRLLNNVKIIDKSAAQPVENEFGKNVENTPVKPPAPQQITKEVTLRMEVDGHLHQFPLLKTGNIVAVIQPRQHNGVSITNLAGSIRDIIRAELGENVRIAQVYEAEPKPECISEILGATGSGPEWKPWEGEIPGLQTWIQNSKKHDF